MISDNEVRCKIMDRLKGPKLTYDISSLDYHGFNHNNKTGVQGEGRGGLDRRKEKVGRF